MLCSCKKILECVLSRTFSLFKTQTSFRVQCHMNLCACVDFKALRTHKDVKFSLDIQRKQLPVGRLLIDSVQETLYFTATQDQHFDYGKNILLQLILYLF